MTKRVGKNLNKKWTSLFLSSLFALSFGCDNRNRPPVGVRDGRLSSLFQRNIEAPAAPEKREREDLSDPIAAEIARLQKEDQTKETARKIELLRARSQRLNTDRDKQNKEAKNQILGVPSSGSLRAEKQKSRKWYELCEKEGKLGGIDTDGDYIPDDCEDYLKGIGWLALDKEVYNGYLGRIIPISDEVLNVGKFISWKSLKAFITGDSKFNRALRALIDKHQKEKPGESDLVVFKELLASAKLYEDKMQREKGRILGSFIDEAKLLQARVDNLSSTQLQEARTYNREIFALTGGYELTESVLYSFPEDSRQEFSWAMFSGAGGNINNLKKYKRVMVIFQGHIFAPGGVGSYHLGELVGNSLAPIAEDMADKAAFFVFQRGSLKVSSVPWAGVRQLKGGYTHNAQCGQPVTGVLVLGEEEIRHWPLNHIFMNLPGIEGEENLAQLPPQAISKIYPPDGCEFKPEWDLFEDAKRYVTKATSSSASGITGTKEQAAPSGSVIDPLKDQPKLMEKDSGEEGATSEEPQMEGINLSFLPPLKEFGKGSVPEEKKNPDIFSMISELTRGQEEDSTLFQRFRDGDAQDVEAIMKDPQILEKLITIVESARDVFKVMTGKTNLPQRGLLRNDGVLRIMYQNAVVKTNYLLRGLITPLKDLYERRITFWETQEEPQKTQKVSEYEQKVVDLNNKYLATQQSQ